LQGFVFAVDLPIAPHEDAIAIALAFGVVGLCQI